MTKKSPSPRSKEEWRWRRAARVLCVCAVGVALITLLSGWMRVSYATAGGTEATIACGGVAITWGPPNDTVGFSWGWTDGGNGEDELTTSLRKQTNVVWATVSRASVVEANFEEFFQLASLEPTRFEWIVRCSLAIPTVFLGLMGAWCWTRSLPRSAKPGQCPKCRYNMIGLSTCPECGSEAATS